MFCCLGLRTLVKDCPPKADAPEQPNRGGTALHAAPPMRVTTELILATTTSTYDSGLLDVILPEFEKTCGCKVSVVAVGSGQAIQLGADGNADVLLVHSPAAEEQFMADGNGVRREPVMYNDLIIVGTEDDPAGIAV